MEIKNTAEIDELIAIQLVAYDKAAIFQRCMFWLSVLIAAIGAVLIFIETDNIAFGLGSAALLITILSAYLSIKLNKFRAFAERVRKATLLTKGLGFNLSKFERQKIRADFPGTAEAVQSRVDTDYYASKSQPGPIRLTEMLEESAFWSKHLFAKSAEKTWFYFVFYSLVTIGLFFGYLHFGAGQDPSTNLKAIQVIMAGLTLLISRDFLGRALAYSGAERAITNILERIQILKERNGTEILQDLYLVLGDYNSAVENAPLFLPGLHGKLKPELDQLWIKYS